MMHLDSVLRHAFYGVIILIFLEILLLSSLAKADKSNLVKVRLFPEILYQGDAATISVSCSPQLDSVTGEWQGSLLPFFRDEGSLFKAILGVDMDAPQGTELINLNISSVEGEHSRISFRFSVLEKDFPVQRLTLPSKMVFLNQADLSRVRREKTELARIWGTSLKQRLWKQKFIVPVIGDVLSPFGVRRVLNNEPRSSHTGVDFRAKAGTPVRASSDGTVALTCNHFFSGRSVFLDHGMGLFTMYFHLSEINVEEGQKVAGGQILGLVGQTGRATGPHLHWGARIRKSRIDPLSLLRLFN